MVLSVPNLTSDYNPLRRSKGIDDIASMMDNIALHHFPNYSDDYMYFSLITKGYREHNL